MAPFYLAWNFQQLDKNPIPDFLTGKLWYNNNNNNNNNDNNNNNNNNNSNNNNNKYWDGIQHGIDHLNSEGRRAL